MKINFCFGGWVNGADLKTVTITETGEQISTDDLTAEEVVDKLNKGVFCISLGDYLYNSNRKTEIEIFDFAEDNI